MPTFLNLTGLADYFLSNSTIYQMTSIYMMNSDKTILPLTIITETPLQDSMWIIRSMLKSLLNQHLMNRRILMYGNLPHSRERTLQFKTNGLLRRNSTIKNHHHSLTTVLVWLQTLRKLVHRSVKHLLVKLIHQIRKETTTSPGYLLKRRRKKQLLSWSTFTLMELVLMQNLFKCSKEMC